MSNIKLIFGDAIEEMKNIDVKVEIEISTKGQGIIWKK